MSTKCVCGHINNNEEGGQNMQKSRISTQYPHNVIVDIAMVDDVLLLLGLDRDRQLEVDFANVSNNIWTITGGKVTAFPLADKVPGEMVAGMTVHRLTSGGCKVTSLVATLIFAIFVLEIHVHCQ